MSTLGRKERLVYVRCRPKADIEPYCISTPKDRFLGRAHFDKRADRRDTSAAAYMVLPALSRYAIVFIGRKGNEVPNGPAGVMACHSNQWLRFQANVRRLATTLGTSRD